MIDNNKLDNMWEEILKEFEEDINKDVTITIDNDKLRENLINIFSIFNEIAYDIDDEKTEECNRILYKDEYFERINYLLKDYMPNYVIELIDSMKCFYKKLCENVEIKEIFIRSKEANNMYNFIELMFTETIVKTLFCNNIADHLFFVQDDKNRLNKAVFVRNLDALGYIYNKIADARKIPRELRRKITLESIA